MKVTAAIARDASTRLWPNMPKILETGQPLSCWPTQDDSWCQMRQARQKRGRDEQLGRANGRNPSGRPGRLFPSMAIAAPGRSPAIRRTRGAPLSLSSRLGR